MIKRRKRRKYKCHYQIKMTKINSQRKKDINFKIEANIFVITEKYEFNGRQRSRND